MLQRLGEENTVVCSAARRERFRGERGTLRQFGEMESSMTLITAALLEWMDLTDHCAGLRNGWEVRRGGSGDTENTILNLVLITLSP